MTTVTAAEFNRAPSAIKRQVVASGEPVVVMQRSTPSVVVMTYENYLDLVERPRITDMAAWLRMEEDIDFEPARLNFDLRAADL